MGALSIGRCSVGYEDRWVRDRAKSKENKRASLKHLFDRVSKPEDRDKLEELISIYLDAHDFTTRVGLEIAKYGDQYSGK